MTMEYEAKKKELLESNLNKLGFTNIIHQPAFKPIEKYLNKGSLCYPNAVGCALTHQYILSNNDIYPFLLLEADATPAFENIQMEFDVPDECDCLYLGICNYAAFGLKWTKYNDNFYKIENTLTSHAILFLKKEYTLKQLDSIQDSLNRGIPLDVGFGELQKHNIVLAPNKYFFYQWPNIKGVVDGRANNPTAIIMKNYP